jgi:transformation/transcription domain-associated protein
MQVKTLSFVAYILKNFLQILKPRQEEIAHAVVLLMHDCPSESSGIRKELLVATRHLWASEFKSSFVSHIDELLDEKVLVGIGVTSKETLR